MGNVQLVKHVQSARLVQIFKQVHNDGLEGVLLLFQLIQSFLENYPRQLSLDDTTSYFHIVLNRNERSGRIYGVAIRVQHQRVRRMVSQRGFTSKRSAIQPDSALAGLACSSSLVLR